MDVVGNLLGREIGEQGVRVRRPQALGLAIEHEAVFVERWMLFKALDRDRQVGGLEALFALFDFSLEQLGIDGALVDVEEGHVVV
ncbi:MAG: hypothetical protein DMF90_18225, partial [Acidobacteria bacterium]